MNFLEKSKQNLKEYKKALKESYVSDGITTISEEELFKKIDSALDKGYIELAKNIFNQYYDDEDFDEYLDQTSSSKSKDKDDEKPKANSSKSKDDSDKKSDKDNKNDVSYTSSGAIVSSEKLKEILGKMSENDSICFKKEEDKSRFEKNLGATDNRLKTQVDDTTLFIVKNSSSLKNGKFNLNRYAKADNEKYKNINSVIDCDSIRVSGGGGSGDAEVTKTQEIIQGAIIQSQLNGADLTKEERLPFIVRASGDIAANVEAIKEIFGITQVPSFIDIPPSWKSTFDGLLTMSFFKNFPAGRYEVIHPDLKSNNNKVEEIKGFLFGNGISEKDVWIPADLYIVNLDKLEDIKTAASNAKTSGSNEEKAMKSVELINGLAPISDTGKSFDIKESSAIAISLKASKAPTLHEVINSVDNLPKCTINNIEEIIVNKTGNSTVYIKSDENFNHHFGDNAVAEFSFRSKDQGKTWQCNASIKGKSSALLGGSAKTNIVDTLQDTAEVSFIGQNRFPDIKMLYDENSNAKFVKFFEEFKSKISIIGDSERETELSLKSFVDNVIFPLSSGQVLKVEEISKDTFTKNHTSASSYMGRVGLMQFLYALAEHYKPGQEDRKRVDDDIQNILRKSFKLDPSVQNTLKIY